MNSLLFVLLCGLISASVANPVDEDDLDHMPPMNDEGVYVDDSLVIQARKALAMQGSLTYKHQEVCYKTDYSDLGCFSTAEPFSAFGRLAVLPKSPQALDVKFMMYTRGRPENFEKIFTGDLEALQQTNFNGNRPTKLIIHGFIDWGTNPWHTALAMQLLTKEDCNVIVVDWHKGSQTTYAQASANARVVGALIAELISFLSESAGTNPSMFHVFGHSLGSHIAGYAGERTPGLARLTGIDPAGPYFENMDPIVRLDETDAEFVDIIHSDADTAWNILTLSGGLGSFQKCGHVDVYPNGGKKQPGCKDKGPITAIIKDGIKEGVAYIAACAHMRAYDYTTESVNSGCPYRSYACNDWDEFKTGSCLRSCSNATNTKTCNSLSYKAIPVADKSVNNAFWMATASKSPFCSYHFQVQLTISSKKNKQEKGFAMVKFTNGNGKSAVSTDWMQLGEDNQYFVPGATYSYLVIAGKEMTNINSIEFKWEKDANIWEVDQWEIGRAEIFVQKISVYSGENQYERYFCDNANDAIKSKKTIQTYSARTAC